jgi:K+-sensing histidine kinase KdpD
LRILNENKDNEYPQKFFEIGTVFHKENNVISEEKKLTLIEVALKESYRLDNFITNILDMAKLENLLVKVSPEKFDVSRLINDSVLRLSNLLMMSKVHIHGEGNLFVRTDGALLTRVICLVLDNAVKYSGANPVIDIAYGHTNSHCFITIRDYGQGVAPAKLETIFEKYTRFAKQDLQNAGTGLGLSIGRAIMNLVGGNLVAENHSEKGMIFTLSFSDIS